MISQKERSRAAAYSSKRADDKGKRCRSWMSNRSCLKSRACSIEHDTAEKAQCKGSRSRNPKKRNNSAERHHARKTARFPSGKEGRLPCFHYKNEIAVMFESVFLGSPSLQTLQHVQKSNGKRLSTHTFAKEERMYQSKKEKEKSPNTTKYPSQL